MTNSTKAILVLVFSVFVFASCGGSNPWLGTYANPAGTITLDVKNDGKASFTALGQTLECTYTTDRDQTLSLNCPEPAGKFTFARQSDGSIVAQDNPVIGRLAKSQR